MKTITGSAQLMSVICSAAEAGAYGSGEVSVSPKGGGDFIKLYGGGIVKTKAVVSASGTCGRKELISRVDSAVDRLIAFSGDGIIRIRAPYPAVIADAKDNGFLRFEREIEIIYRGGMLI